MSLPELLRTTEDIARRAGAVLMTHFDRLDDEDVAFKSATRDLVTKADLAAERVVLDALAEHFPDDGIHAEESGVRDAGAEHVWYVDPLDGTTNFVHRLPMFGVSLARATRGEVDLACVFLPRLDECFTAARSHGAQLNGRPIRVSRTEALPDALLATGFPYRRQFLVDNNLENFNRLFLRQRGLRRMGSAAADLAYVACGRLDAFWELHLSPWDVAAGGLLVLEAGGEVDTVVAGGDWLHDANLIAGPPALAQGLREVLREGRDADYPPLGERASS